MYEAGFAATVFAINPRRVSGRSGWVPTRLSPPAERRASLALAGGAALHVAAQAAVVVRPRRQRRAGSARCAVGLGVGLASAGLAVSAQRALGAAWRTSVSGTGEQPLVRAGPYAVVRHPVYTAFAGAALAVSLMCPSPAAAIADVLVLTGLQLQVRGVEEPALAAVYGEEYARYSHATGRFIPCLRTPAGVSIRAPSRRHPVATRGGR